MVRRFPRPLASAMCPLLFGQLWELATTTEMGTAICYGATSSATPDLVHEWHDGRVDGGCRQYSHQWTVVGTGDFNGDGMTDIVWRDTAGDTAIWLMNGATFRQPAELGRAPDMVHRADRRL